MFYFALKVLEEFQDRYREIERRDKFIKGSSLIELEIAMDILDKFIENKDILELDKKALEKGFSGKWDSVKICLGFNIFK